MNWKKFLPILNWLPGYGREQIRGDLSAGLTVGVMLIPQGMAYAMIAGMPPIYGLYASIVPLLIYAVFGTSRQLAVGPVAMVALLVAAGVGQMAEIGSEAYIGLAILLALMVGILQFSLGVFRLGFLVNFLSHPVISGFTSAAALIIGLSQLKHLLGIDIPRSNFIHEVLGNAFTNLDQLSLPTLLIGAAGIALILVAKRINKALPGPLLAVVFGILAVWLGGMTEMGVNIVGEVPKGLPAFSLPPISIDSMQALLPIALTIALVSFMESIAVAKAIQAKHKDYEVDSNQELIGLGLANIGGSFFQAFPTTGGFSRTAVNDQAGAKTGLAAIISAVLIALTLLFLTPLFYFLPQAILASIIMVAVFGLIDLKEAVHLWRSKKDDFFMLLATFIATLSLGIEEGIIIGLLLSLGMVIFRSAYPHVALLGRIPETTAYRNVNRFPEAKQHPGVMIMRFDAQLYFANVGFFRDKLQAMESQQAEPLKLVILNAESVSSIDSSAAHILEEIVKDYHARGIHFYIAGINGPVRDALTKAHVTETIGRDCFFLHVADAVEHFNLRKDDAPPAKGKSRFQTNITA